MSLKVEDFVNPFAFFRAVHTAPELQLEENDGSRALRPRASAIGNCAREVGYLMAKVPKSNPQYEDLKQVTQQYANEQGRIAEDLSFIALRNQQGMPLRVQVISWDLEDPGQQGSVSDKHPMSGHFDGTLVWLEEGEEPFKPGDDIPEERFFFSPSMFGREGDEKFRVGVEHKHPGVNTYGRIAKSTVVAERPGWVYQAIVYGEDQQWDFVLLIDVALDATAIRSPKMGYLKHIPDPLEHKGRFDLMDLRELRAAFWKPLRKRARALSKAVWPEGRIDPDEDEKAAWARAGSIRREQSGTANFPCGWCEWRDRCNIDGDGEVVIPAAPLG
jgi:hypothetical protein